MKVPMENLHLPENVINLSKNDKKAIKNKQVWETPYGPNITMTGRKFYAIFFLLVLNFENIIKK